MGSEKKVDGPVDGAGEGPEEDPLLKLGMGSDDGHQHGNAQGPVDGAGEGPEEGALLELGMLEGNEEGSLNFESNWLSRAAE
jgi:hypothetical protein